jgi:ATP-binding cassette subfamily F protein 3
MKEAQVSVRKEDKSLRNFSIPAQFGAMEVLNVNAVSLPSSQGGGVATIPLELPVVMNRGMRMHLFGPNGIGKTTLLQHIVENKLDGCSIAGGIRVGYYRQDFSTLNFEHTVVESLREAALDNSSEQNIRKTASDFLLTGDIMHQKIGTLSEGQKGLCAFARLVLQEPGLLILDEPTNHINFRHLPAIQKALNEYEGTMIMVSHDQSFVKKVKTDVKLDLGEEVSRFNSLLAAKQKLKVVHKSPIDLFKLQKLAAAEAAAFVNMMMKTFTMTRMGGAIKKYSKMRM